MATTESTRGDLIDKVVKLLDERAAEYEDED